MAVPPLRPEEREAQAEAVLRGVVLATDARTHSASGDTAYVSSLRVAEATVVRVHYRRTAPAPPGATGPVGQDAVMVPGQRVVAYVVADGFGRWQLLEPNGWERV